LKKLRMREGFLRSMIELIQLSDLHGSREVLKALKEISQGADLIVVSGDVTNFGDSSYFNEFMLAVSETGIRSLYVPGNNDLPTFTLPKGVEPLDCKKVNVSGLVFGGLGGSNPTPFKTPYEISEEEASRRLGELGKVDVLVCHTPPFDTPADRLAGGGHAGSRAVKEYLLRSRPRLLLCGHIHEAVSKFYLHETLVVNPGGAIQRRYSRIKIDHDIKASLLLF
jgi:Icc-related predicted phosphoesterase